MTVITYKKLLKEVAIIVSDETSCVDWELCQKISKKIVQYLFINFPTRCFMVTSIEKPVYRWEFRYSKNDTFVHLKEHAPNFAYRFIQKLILGVDWRRI